MTAADFELSVAPLRPEAQRFQFEGGIGTLSDESGAAIAEQFRELLQRIAVAPSRWPAPKACAN